jgi:hypothetical protein
MVYLSFVLVAVALLAQVSSMPLRKCFKPMLPTTLSNDSPYTVSLFVLPTSTTSFLPQTDSSSMTLYALHSFSINPASATALPLTGTETLIASQSLPSKTPLASTTGADFLDENKSSMVESTSLSPSPSSAPLTHELAAKQFCEGFPQLPIGDGSQKRETGMCLADPLGSLPSEDKMVSTLITSPEDGAVISAGEPFTSRFDVDNMELANFANPNTNFNAQPQTLNSNGIIKGHIHMVIQKLAEGESDSVVAPDAKVFQFFKGLDFQAQNGRTLEFTTSLTVPGFYRLCTLSGANSHQSLMMPVARRGSQDDCIRLTIVKKDDSISSSVAKPSEVTVSKPVVSIGVDPNPRTSVAATKTREVEATSAFVSATEKVPIASVSSLPSSEVLSAISSPSSLNSAIPSKSTVPQPENKVELKSLSKSAQPNNDLPPTKVRIQ